MVFRRDITQPVEDQYLIPLQSCAKRGASRSLADPQVEQQMK
jgi:hypothetical protein